MILLHEMLSSYAAGLEHVRQLEARLETEWQDRLGEARQAARLRYQQAVQDWELYERASQANFERRMRIWKMGEAEKDQRYQAKRVLWQKRLADIERRHPAQRAAWQAKVLTPARRAADRVWFFTLALFVLGGLSYQLTTGLALNWEGGQVLRQLPWMLWLGCVPLAVWAVYLESHLRQLGRQGPHRAPLPAEPQREPAARKPQPDPPTPAPILTEPPLLDLSRRWLLAVNRRAFDLPEYTPESEGNAGEKDLFLLLAEHLPDDYLALRNLLVRRRLDIDLIVIGPAGIWLLDSKYWSRWIGYGLLGWERDKEQPEDREYLPDLGWGNQKRIAIQALQRARLLYDWEKVVQGGIAFTHPNCTLEISQDCPVVTGRLEDWPRRIQAAQPVPGFSLEVCLQAADALVKYGFMHRKEEVPGFQTVPAARLADPVYYRIQEEIEQYLA